MKFHDYFISVVRTLVPAVVGLFVVQLANVGVEVDAGALETVLFGVASTGYYALIRALELKYPKLGWLLGYAVPPVYPGTPSNPTPTVAIVDHDAGPPPQVLDNRRPEDLV